jgi:hypothetical protein
MTSPYFVVRDEDNRTVPLNLPHSTMKFYDEESAELMLAHFRRLGHAMTGFYVNEISGE